MSDNTSSPHTPAPKTNWTAWIVVSALLVGAAGAAFYFAAKKTVPVDTSADDVVTVTIRDKQCFPNDITVPAGRTTFHIVNQSDRALEWEILDGVMVIDERENIAPGFSQTMRVKLHPGEYQITCGLLSSPRGKLTVTPSAASDAEAARPPLTNYIGALAEYQVYLHHTIDALSAQVATLSSAIAAGDLAQAQQQYSIAHGTYKRMQSVGELFGDLDTKIDAHATLFEQREKDPAFTGFYRIAHGLFVVQDTQNVKPVIAQLTTDIAALRERLPTLEIWPDRLAGGASRFLRRVADNLPTDKEDASAFWAQLQGAYDGTHRIMTLLQPLLSKAAPTLDATLVAQFTDWEKAMMQANTTHLPDQAHKDALITAIDALSTSLGQVNATLGLE